jgi:hypothetical protein
MRAGLDVLLMDDPGTAVDFGSRPGWDQHAIAANLELIGEAGRLLFVHLYNNLLAAEHRRAFS